MNILDESDYVFDRFYSEMRKLYIDIDDFLLHTGVDLLNIFSDEFMEKNEIKDFITIKNNKISLTDLGVINSDTLFELFFNTIIK